MISLRGKLTRTLVERKAPTPPTLRSNVVGPSTSEQSQQQTGAGVVAPPAGGSTAPPAAAAAPAAGETTSSEAASGAGGSSPPIATTGAAEVTPPAGGAVPGALEKAAKATTAAQIEALGLVEEWTWRGVWAFGELPEEEEEDKASKKEGQTGPVGAAAAAKAAENADKRDAGQATSSTPGEGGTEAIPSSTDQQSTSAAASKKSGTDGKENAAAKPPATTDTTNTSADSAPTPKPAPNPPPPVKKRPGRPPKSSSSSSSPTRPRPFTYRWLKAKEAGSVIVPSSLVLMAHSVDLYQETEKTGKTSAEKEGATSEGSDASGGDKKPAPEQKKESEKPQGTAVKTSETTDAKMASAGNAKEAGGDAVMADADGAPKPTNTTEGASKENVNEAAGVAAASTTNAGESASASKPAADSSDKNTKAIHPTDAKEPTFKPPATYGEQPYKDAGKVHPLGTCPISGKWEGHFENVVPNTSSSKKKRRDKRDNRIREMFYLFFNATPPPDARDTFVDSDSTIAANGLLDDRGSTSISDKDSDKSSDEKEEKHPLLKKDLIHVRGYGTNRFGTFEIVGSFNPKTGMLQCRRMYVPVPSAAEISRATGQRRSSSGRFLSGLDLSIPGEEEEKRRGSSSRKRKSTWKKRDAEEVGGADGAAASSSGGAVGAASGSIDIASIVKKRSRLSNESAASNKSTPGGGAMKQPPQCRGALSDNSQPSVNALPASATFAAGTKPAPSPRAPPAKSVSMGTGKKGSKKKKAKGGQSAPPIYPQKVPLSGSVAPPVTIVPTLPSAGDPFLARWRAAHYLYYQRVEQEPEEGEGSSWGAGKSNSANPSSSNSGGGATWNPNAALVKINYVIYEGEMHDGLREGRGICLYNNNTLYEGQWKKNKEHGTGTLMTSDRKRIIYSGTWEKGKMHGQGSYHYYIEKSKTAPKENGRYVGHFRQNLRNGHGVYTLPDGSVYDGEWRDNIQNGWGVFRWPDGSVYEGQWKDGRRHGTSGILMASDGFRYEGSWVNNSMEGRGVATYPKGQIYDGTWVAGKREGRGTIRFTNGAVYEGRFKEDYMEGQGTMKMNRNVIIPKLTGNNDRKSENAKDEPSSSEKSDEEAAHDWMIPLQFQSDISHIHQKAGFTQIGL
eukprot:CAMPEP_0183721278 /NCGR_PEP_ID=MMETSP0737-20130205/13604_1 /TAXON_ID=385413 /ORGANISM="Thalassiosira miniscula, Strain CCMP1093" /LENGTH=1127 /DNA_ID=CAMNT_0025951261 /DNA_START=193 /DNA_END=3576 /DNA_ORIENTATION=-